MKKIIIILGLTLILAISGCIPFAGGSVAAHDGLFGVNGDINSLEMEQGITVKQVYDAIKEAIKKHPKEFEIKGDDYGSEKSTVWTFSNKYNQPVTFYALKRDNNVYLGVYLSSDRKSKDEKMKHIYYLEDLVLDNLQ
ncbi:hypothetical protein fh0823_22720 [Francisella halioticida]|uniref:DUF3887 domain-containing protein n=1 Tax=Francisella halioticida TaxID=549298 RepID=A0ABM6LWZ1_9GAMM|nr:hypothetical protein [Francisella halioticida]ASG67164.1 hypothetical protein CDV26_01090 [Francisella halioticida]BCD92133.1 hypothetical protein fh0823_22720 [Francisella halioticida]